MPVDVGQSSSGRGLARGGQVPTGGNQTKDRTRHRGRPRRLLWPTININKPRARLGIGRVRSRAVCWLLKQARAAVDENEEAASSNRSRYEARHMPSAAMASRAARAGRRQPNSSNAAHRRSCAIRLAVRLIRGTAPKGAKMFAASDMASRCEAQSSRLVPSRTTRHLQRASRSGQISRTGSKTTNGGVQFQSR